MFEPRVIARCPACGSKLTSTPRRWWAWLGYQVPWQVVAWLCVWRTGVNLVLGGLLVFVLVWPYQLAEQRLRFAFWFWRHPLRCRNGGHAEPCPT